MQADGARSLVTFMGSNSGQGGDAAACEMAATILLSLALLPEAPRAAADEGLVTPLVQVRYWARMSGWEYT